jgi:tRNA nucleotidyltransferase (CCA-adding enzyme)
MWVRFLLGAQPMTLKPKFNIPDEVKIISRVLWSAKFENYLVGGCVRDILLGKPPKDWDITTIALPREIEALYENTFYENAYGTVGVVNEVTQDPTLKVVEITPYRTESGYSDFRHPDGVKWAKTLEEDLKRRDFTINALAYDIEKDALVDMFDGEKDLKKKIIRTVGDPNERFTEDALRMLRACASPLN